MGRKPNAKERDFYARCRDRVYAIIDLIKPGATTADAAKALRLQGKKVRVVSMPSTDVFDAQSAEYKDSVLPAAVTRRVAVEAGIADYWFKYVGLNGAVVGMSTFGESAPAGELFEHFGFTVDNVVAQANRLFA